MSHFVWHVCETHANLPVMNIHMTASERWRIVTERVCQEEFLYGVVTTGVVCATSCASRPPRPENVRYFDDLASALLAGYRPCKRCIGKDDACVQIAEMCRALGEDCRISELACRFGLTSRHVQRLFKQTLGISPKEYQIESRIGRFFSFVRDGMKITDASYAAGFPSPSRLNEQLRARTGISATEHRERFLGEPVFFTICETPIGIALLAQSVTALCFAGFYESETAAEAALAEEFSGAETIPVQPTQLEPISSAFAAAVSGEFDHLGKLPLDIRGTGFQRAVWSQVRKIPAGETRTYAEVAEDIGQPTATRAVANALARNRIALAVPCHRVVPATTRKGKGGYRWGADRKTLLVANESDV